MDRSSIQTGTLLLLSVCLFVASGLRPTTRCQWNVPFVHSRDRAAQYIDDDLFPKSERGRRFSLVYPKLSEEEEPTIMDGRDPRLDEAYGEFPLSSLDALLDYAERITNRRPRRIVDVGSGCGRLVFYLALSRSACNVSGIELSETFHSEACSVAENALVTSLISHYPILNSHDSQTSSSISLHLGPASDFPKVINEADLIFCYSTAFPGSGYRQSSAASEALLLAPEWSELFSRHCKEGCICITTDKALDPLLGWQTLGRLEVPNPEVVSSTGFVQIYRSISYR
jgi:hypothetical protein